MRYFHNDYNQMCHPSVLEKLISAQKDAMPGYGTDPVCLSAAEKVRTLCCCEDADVHFLVGGTQTNLTVIDAALRPHQGVICASSGHINVHETGAVEATGHKVIAIQGDLGKLSAQDVEKVMQSHWEDPDHEHTVQPKMVYISNSTELGTIYYRHELEALSAVCKKYGLFLFVDGARLGYALQAKDSDLDLPTVCRLADAFYIGMTKQGAMFGECLVITHPMLKQDFRYMIKQHGGMLAKGWLLGLQLEALLEKDLYFTLSRQANEHADTLRSALTDMGYDFLVETSTNQLFPVLPDAILPALSEDVTFIKMDAVGEAYHAVRFCTSWATTAEDVEFLCCLLHKLSK